jgi:hypothetical protein
VSRVKAEPVAYGCLWGVAMAATSISSGRPVWVTVLVFLVWPALSVAGQLWL